MSVKADSSGFDREEFEDNVEQKMKETVTVEYRNVISSAIMSVLVGGILLALGVVILSDFFELANQSDGYVGSRLSRIFGLDIALLFIAGAVVLALAAESILNDGTGRRGR